MSKRGTPTLQSSPYIDSITILLTSKTKCLTMRTTWEGHATLHIESTKQIQLQYRITNTTHSPADLCWRAVQKRRQLMFTQKPTTKASQLTRSREMLTWFQSPLLTPISQLWIRKYSEEYKPKGSTILVIKSKGWIPSHREPQAMRFIAVTDNSQLWFQTRLILILFHSTWTTKVTICFQLSHQTKTCSVSEILHRLAPVVSPGRIFA